MRSVKRIVALLAIGLALTGTAAGAAGCGSTGHFVGGVIAHHVANRVLGRRTAGKVFCLYHGHRVLVDLRTHHVFAAGLNAIAAYNSCKAGFGRKR